MQDIEHQNASFDKLLDLLAEDSNLLNDVQFVNLLEERSKTKKSNNFGFWFLTFMLLFFALVVILTVFGINKDANDLRTEVNRSYKNAVDESRNFGVEFETSSLQDGFRKISEDYSMSLEILGKEPGDSLSKKIDAQNQQLLEYIERNNKLQFELEKANQTANYCKPISNGTECKVYFGTDGKDLSLLNENFIDSIFGNKDFRSASSVRIVGFSDTKGPSELNQMISQRRAKSVRDRVLRHYSGSDLYAVGMGETDETADDVSDPSYRVVVLTVIHD